MKASRGAAARGASACGVAAPCQRVHALPIAGNERSFLRSTPAFHVLLPRDRVVNIEKIGSVHEPHRATLVGVAVWIDTKLVLTQAEFQVRRNAGIERTISAEQHVDVVDLHTVPSARKVRFVYSQATLAALSLAGPSTTRLRRSAQDDNAARLCSDDKAARLRSG